LIRIDLIFVFLLLSHNEDGEYFIDFLETTGKIPNRFRIPNQHDSIWIEPEKVLYVLSEPPAKIGSHEHLWR
jgi:hypothetical protein